MKIAFFAARRIHQTYFQQVADALIQSGHSATVIWHKNLWANPRWLLNTRTPPSRVLAAIVRDHVREKQNSSKGQQRPPQYWKKFRNLKRLESRLLFYVYRHAIRRQRPDAIVIWNGLKFRQRIVKAAAESLGIRVFVMENGLLPGMTTFDPVGVNFHNSVPRDSEFFRKIESTDADTQPSALLEKPEGLPEHYVFIPFQVNTDSQVVLFSPWLKDMFALVAALRLAETSLGEQMPDIVLKTHPACDQNYDALAAELAAESARIRLLTSGDTTAIIANADAVATINSTVGIEAILTEKPALVLGQAFYDLPGLTLNATDQRSLEQALVELPGFVPDADIRNGLLHYLKNTYQIPGRWQDAAPEHIKLVADRIRQEGQACG